MIQCRYISSNHVDDTKSMQCKNGIQPTVARTQFVIIFEIFDNFIGEQIYL